MGIDIGINTTMAIGCLDLRENESYGNMNPVDIHVNVIIGKYLKSINQWFNKVTSILYSKYMKQQGFIGYQSSGTERCLHISELISRR